MHLGIKQEFPLNTSDAILTYMISRGSRPSTRGKGILKGRRIGPRRHTHAKAVKNREHSFHTRLDALMNAHKIQATVFSRLQGTKSGSTKEIAQALTRAVGHPVPESQVLKVSVFRIETHEDGRKIFHPVIVAVPGDRKIDNHVLRTFFGVHSRHVQFATPEDFTTITGAKPGFSTPFPLGSIPAREVAVIMDNSLLSADHPFFVSRDNASQYLIPVKEMLRLLGRMGVRERKFEDVSQLG